MSPSDFEYFLQEILSTITNQMNGRLTKLAIEEEVLQALFMIHPEKATRPDGMTLIFSSMLGT